MTTTKDLEDVDDHESFHRLSRWMDHDARRHVCAELSLEAGGTPDAQLAQLGDALDGDAEGLLASLRRDDLVAMLRMWWFAWGDDGLRGHLLGIRDASLEALRVSARRLLVDEWLPTELNAAEVPGTPLRLCWYQTGAAHEGEFDDDDGPFVDGDLFADAAVYTIIAPEALDSNERSGIRFEEGRPWVAGARLLEAARRAGKELVVVFADAKSTSRLVGWTVVRSLSVSDHTSCVTGPIVRVRRARGDSIRKLSDGAPLADNYIRPYVPCHCPSFVRRSAARLQALRGVERSLLPARRASSRGAAGPTLAFSWGYEGWGSHTAELVDMIDAVEAERGFAPPLFVDVRVNRKVRAVGFREKAFEKLLGPQRYVWLRGLGNRAVAGRAQKMTIDEPGEAKRLLALVEQRAATGARVIFFCSCGSPLGRAQCHRRLVVQLLLAEAGERKLPLAVHEWPGGSPLVAEMAVPPDAMRRLRAISSTQDGTRTRLPLPSELPLVRAAALPHFSVLRCRQAGEELLAVSGPAILTPQGWALPVHGVAIDADLAKLQAQLDEEVMTRGLVPFGAEMPLPLRWRHEAH